MSAKCSASPRSDAWWARLATCPTVVVLVVSACGPGPSEEASPDGVEADAPRGMVITPEGVGDLRIGQTAEEAMATGLVTDLVPRCDLGEGPILYGDLRGGLEGSVAIWETVASIEVASGAETDLGLGPGDDIDDVSRLYPSEDYDVDIDEGYADLFGGRLITIEQDGKLVYSVLADESGEAVAEVSVPSPLTCE